MKPGFPYYGGKARMAPMIAELLPPHQVYVEPYAGSAAVLFAKEPTRHEVLNDLDGNVMAFYRAMRDSPEELHRALALTPYSRAEYLAADLSDPALDVVERARRFVVRTAQSVNATGASMTTGWALSTTRNQSRPATFAGAVDRLPHLAERLRRVYLEQADALEVIARHGRNPSATIYVDPPYLASTRRALSGTYRVDAHDLDHHKALLATVCETEAAVVLSGYDADLYRDMLTGWRVVELSVGKPSANRSGEKQSTSTEVLWINRKATL